MTDFTVIIPARYQSTRFPGKPLAQIQDKPMVQWVHQRALEAKAKRVIVATDDERIAQVVKEFGGEVCMTSASHESGTERLAEVVRLCQFSDDEIIVNVQGDEPFIPAQNIRQVAMNLASNSDAKMSTLSHPISSAEDLTNPNVVKVVCDQRGMSLYFSRSPVPYDRERFMGQEEIQDIGDFYQRHIGLYAYTAGFIIQYINMTPSPIEKIESLEQLRVLWHGEKIHVEQAEVDPPIGIDTPEDLTRLLESIK